MHRVILISQSGESGYIWWLQLRPFCLQLPRRGASIHGAPLVFDSSTGRALIKMQQKCRLLFGSSLSPCSSLSVSFCLCSFFSSPSPTFPVFVLAQLLFLAVFSPPLSPIHLSSPDFSFVEIGWHHLSLNQASSVSAELWFAIPWTSPLLFLFSPAPPRSLSFLAHLHHQWLKLMCNSMTPLTEVF